MSNTEKRSVCPYDCPDTCGLIVEVENGRALKVSGDPDHPYTRGVLCAKMNQYELTVHSPKRLTTPLKRVGKKGEGLFEPIGWDEAVSLIADRWRGIIAEYGAESILPYSYAGTMGVIQRNSGHPFFHRMGASRLERTICSPAKGAGWKAVMGETPAVDPDEVIESDLVILWGINSAVTTIHFQQRVQEARKRGASVWLIDTYRTATARGADKVVLIRPGSDGALALGLMHILADGHQIDRDFIDRYVQGYDEFAAKILPDYTPSYVSLLTGIPEELIKEMATAYGEARRPFIRLGSGLSRYGNGAMTVRTIACLPAVVGAYGRTGAGCFPDTSTGAAFFMSDVTREDFMAAPTRSINMNCLGNALAELNDPPVKSLYVYHSNPAAVTPDQNAVIRGLMKDDLFTIVHERFMTDTARYADILLPATSSLEHSDIYRSYGTTFIQRAKAVIPPVGESRSNFQVFSLLAEAMGFEEPFFRQSADSLIDHLLAKPSPLRDGIDVEQINTLEPVKLSIATGPGRFMTGSGKIEIFNPGEKETLPRYLPTHEEIGFYPLRLMTAPNLHSLNASFYERDDLRKKQGRMEIKMNPEDAIERNLSDGEIVNVFNDLGGVLFYLDITGSVPSGVVVAEGVWWSEFAPGESTVNALVSQRLTDCGGGSTFYDNRVDVKGL